jgi:hypothetical protein
MSFLHPTLAMVGLAAISLPIIIHLLIRRRVKPVRWAAMKFLMQAYKQRRRRLILEQLLLLAARCLLVALIALAIARLMLGSGVGAGVAARPTSLVLMIDDSLTSGADGALERLKDRALALLSELDPGAGDTVALVTLSAPASGVVLPPSSDIGAVRAIIQGLTPDRLRRRPPRRCRTGRSGQRTQHAPLRRRRRRRARPARRRRGPLRVPRRLRRCAADPW